MIQGVCFHHFLAQTTGRNRPTDAPAAPGFLAGASGWCGQIVFLRSHQHTLYLRHFHLQQLTASLRFTWSACAGSAIKFVCSAKSLAVVGWFVKQDRHVCQSAVPRVPDTPAGGECRESGVERRKRRIPQAIPCGCAGTGATGAP